VPEKKEDQITEFETDELRHKGVINLRDGESRRKKRDERRSKKRGDETPLPIIVVEEDGRKPAGASEEPENNQTKKPEKAESQSFFAKLARRIDKIMALRAGLQ